MSNQKQQHTNEPWAYNKATFRIWSEGNGQYDGNDPIICNISVQHMQPNEAHANAERIVECVNACEGMIDPANDIMALRKALDNIKQRQLEAEKERDELKRIVKEDIDSMATLQAERDELLVALKQLTTGIKRHLSIGHDIIHELVEAEKAISKSKGGTNG